MDQVQALVTLLEHPAGFGVNLFTMLCAYRLEDGRYAVHEDSSSTETIHLTALAAAEDFLLRRQARKLGYDFEAPT